MGSGPIGQITKTQVAHPATAVRSMNRVQVNTPQGTPIISPVTHADIKTDGVDISKEKATIYKNLQHLKLIKSNAMVGDSNRTNLNGLLAQVSVALENLATKGVDVPKHVLQDIKDLTDPAKRLTVINAYASLASIYAYYAFRVVGAVAVLGIPHVTIIATVLNTLAAAALLVGEGAVRLPTTIGFQHMILRALSRGPEYYKTSKTDKLQGAGMDFDPKKDIPFEFIKDAPECTSVLYISNEDRVLLRSLFGHSLIENSRQSVIVECNSESRRKEFEGNVAEVEKFSKDILDRVIAAKGRMGKLTIEQAKAELVVELEKIRDAHQAQAKKWLDSGMNKTKNRQQGEAAALDDYLGMQFLMHAAKWQQRIDAINAKAGDLNAEQMKVYLASCYQYLEHKFTFKVNLNFRTTKTVDIDLYKRMLGGISSQLEKDGLPMTGKVTKEVLKRIVEAIEKENNAIKRPLSKSFKKIRDRVNGEGKADEKIDAYIEKILENDKATTGEVLANILMEQLSRDRYRAGIKAGARSDVFDRFGRTFVKTGTLFGSTVEMTVENWDKIASEKVNYFKETSRKTWSNPEFIGSFDKDYVPISIDPLTGEFTDVFRNNVPMYKKCSKTEGRVNIALFQNLQINANTQLEGGLDEMGRRLFLDEPHEPVSKGSESDQQPWYGAFVLPVSLENALDHYTREGKTGKQFLELACQKLYTQFGFIKDKVKIKALVDAVTKEMGEDKLEQNIDRTTGGVIIEWMKKKAPDMVIATGIGPGRGFFGGMFSCGTCELESRAGITNGYNRPYVQSIDGKIMAQADIRYNPDTRRMEIFDYQNRYSRQNAYGAVESFYMEALKEHELTKEEIAVIAAEYPGKTIKVEGNRIHVLNSIGNTEKVVWFYKQNPEIAQIKALNKGKEIKIYPDKVEVINKQNGKIDATFMLSPACSWNGNFADCRKTEVDYSRYDTEGVIVRDSASDGTYYETRLSRGRVKEETFYATPENLEEVIANIYATREIDQLPDVYNNPDDPNEIIIKAKTHFPDMVTTYHGVNGYEEVVQTPAVHQPDKWITEDMATTYWHMLTGWQTEIQPVEAGRAVGPSDFFDMAKMHRRWFKGGPEVEMDFQLEMKANGIDIAINGIPVPGLRGLTRSPVGWLINQAKLWPRHTITDLLLYGIPPAFYACLYPPLSELLPKGLNPLACPQMYIPVFIAYLFLTLGMYVRPMGQLRNSHKDIWYKEALLRMLGPAYVEALKLARGRQPLPWDATSAGERGIPPLRWLLGIAWRREVNRVTALAGIGLTAGLVFWSPGLSNIPSPVANLSGIIFNWIFPFINFKLFSTGVKRFYGYWTSFDGLAMYSMQQAGIEYKDVKTADGKTEKSIKIEADPVKRDQRVITFTAKNRYQAWNAVGHITGGWTPGSMLAKSANATLGNVLKVLGKVHVKDWRPFKKDNNLILQVNDSAQLVGEAQYVKVADGIRVTLRVERNQQAANFRYESFEKREWVDGNYYFSRDIVIQLNNWFKNKIRKLAGKGSN